MISMIQDDLLQDRLLTVKISEIILNPFQPRKFFEEKPLEELAQSIIAHGLIHPPLVRPLSNGLYELVSGERRLQACKLAKLERIPVYIRSGTECNSAEMALIENIQRVNLNPIEIAKALSRLVEEFHLTQEELAVRLGKSRSSLTNYLRLLTLPQHIQESILNLHISMGHAKAILALDGAEKQNLLHELILRDDLNVREAEDKASKINEKVKRKPLSYQDRNFHLEQLAEKIQHHLGTKVHIQGKGKRGRISIDYYNYDDLDRLLAILTGD